MPNSLFFLKPANITTGRFFGGLASAINKKFATSLLDWSDIYITVELGWFVLLCIYMPTTVPILPIRSLYQLVRHYQGFSIKFKLPTGGFSSVVILTRHCRLRKCFCRYFCLACLSYLNLNLSLYNKHHNIDNIKRRVKLETQGRLTKTRNNNIVHLLNKKKK